MTPLIGKRALPSRPHLDHLRKQAKARLAEIRAAQPEARLADAQRALAHEYGFSTWGALRAEVFQRIGTQHGHHLRTRRRRTAHAIRDREREANDALSEQAAHAESQTGFFLSGAATNIGVLFVLIAILLSVYVYTLALPGW
jgi:hypothetical protein